MAALRTRVPQITLPFCQGLTAQLLWAVLLDCLPRVRTRSCCGLCSAVAAKAEEHELMTCDFETGQDLQVSQGFVEPAGIYFRSAATALALEVVVVVA